MRPRLTRQLSCCAPSMRQAGSAEELERLRFAARMSRDMLRGRRRIRSRRLQCFPRIPNQVRRTEHICSA